MSLYYHTLANGLRLVHIMTPSRVAWCGLAVNAGSRDEASGYYGLAHFVEHTIFKGTTHRRAWHILNRMERVGGELNAYTTKEGTMLYSVFPDEHLPRAVDLLADLVQWSVFPQEELDRERDVVLEEAASYRDTPSDAVYDDFEDLLFAGSELGHNILGRKEDLELLTRDDCMRYLKTLYVPANMAFFSVGPARPERVFGLAEKAFGGMSHALAPRHRAVPTAVAPFNKVIQIGTHQAHTVVGAQVPDMKHPLRHALMLLNNILGGPGMNSRLNLSLRERHGLVYTVDSSMVSYADTGLWAIYFGCDQKDVGRCRRLVRRELDRLADQPLSPTRLSAAKRQLQGQLAIASDSREQFALDFAKNYLHTGTLRSLTDIMAHIDRLTADDLQQVARQLFAPEQLTTLIYS